MDGKVRIAMKCGVCGDKFDSGRKRTEKLCVTCVELRRATRHTVEALGIDEVVKRLRKLLPTKA